MRHQVDIPHGLSAIAIDAAQAERIGKMAVSDPAAGENPVVFSAGRYAEIFTDVVNGEL